MNVADIEKRLEVIRQTQGPLTASELTRRLYRDVLKAIASPRKVFPRHLAQTALQAEAFLEKKGTL